MKNKKISIIYTFMLSFLFICTFHTSVSAADPKLVTTLDSAFEKIESYIVKISTPAAAVSADRRDGRLRGGGAVLLRGPGRVHL